MRPLRRQEPGRGRAVRRPLLALMAFAACALAQPRFEYRAQHMSWQQQFLHMSWQLNYADHTEKITQAYLPAVFDIAIARESHLMIGTAAGWSNAALAANHTLNGLADTQLRFSQRLAGRWLMGAGVNLPTGDSRLDYDENTVANRLAEGILGFPLQRLGVGTDWEFSLAHARDLSESLGWGLGATVLLPGKFEFRQNAPDTYQPGARYTVSTTLNHLGATLPWRVNVLAEFYGQDELNGLKFFRQGWQLEPSGSWEWRWARRWEMSWSFRQVWKDNNQILTTPENAKSPAHYYVDNSTFALVELHHDWHRRVRTGAQFGWSHFGDSNQQLSRATIWRMGVNAVLKISEHFILNAAGDYAAGHAEAGMVDLRGYGLTASLAARL